MVMVALIKCESYDESEVKKAVKRGLDLLGGPTAFVHKNEHILLKPNLLSADPPEKCVTTHPAVFKAAAELFIEHASKLTFGDSPAFNTPKAAATKAGIWAVAQELNMDLSDFITGTDVFFEDALQNKRMKLAKGAVECDGIISLPKLKTHGFAKMTGSIKNQFGCVPGTLKGEFHVKVPDINDFSKMLVDINSYLKPRLFIMDGIMAMEGNGPRGGNPKKMNLLLLSSDAVALDATVCRIVNLNPELVPTIKYGLEAGLGTYKEDEIELVGDPLSAFVSMDFNVDRKPLKPYKGGGAMTLAKNLFVPRPQIDSAKCVKCGICVNMCPVNPKAVDFHDGNKKNVPTYKYNRCIRCYCCQELCPESAIHLSKPFIRRFIMRSK